MSTFPHNPASETQGGTSTLTISSFCCAKKKTIRAWEASRKREQRKLMKLKLDEDDNGIIAT